MKTITFTHTFTFPEPAVIGFALFLGYSNTKQVVVKDENDIAIGFNTVPNDETEIAYVTRLSKEHSLEFTAKWAKFLSDQEVARQAEIIRAQVEAVVVKPVVDALVVTVVENEI